MTPDFKKYGEPVTSPVTKVAPSDFSKYGVTTEEPVATETQAEPFSTQQASKNVAGGAVYSVSAPGRTIQNLLSKGIEKLTGIKDFGRSSKEGFEESTKTDVDTTSGKIGQFAGEVATFAIPGGFAAKATTGAGILAKMGAQGLSDAVVQSLNQGEINKNTIDAGIIGAIFPGAGIALSSLKKEFAPTVINSLIKPLAKQFSYGKNPGKVVAEMGITANSLDDLAVKISSARNSVGEQLTSLASKVPNTVRINASQALSSFDEALQKAVQNNDQALFNRLNETRDALTKIMGLSDGKITAQGTRILDDLTYEQALKVKQRIGNITKWTGQQTEDETVNGALTRAYGALKGQMDEVTSSVDEKLAALLRKGNDDYANLTAAEIATKYRDVVAQRANMLPFGAKTIGTGAGLVTAAATGGITVPLLVGFGVAGLDKALATPAFKTRVAAWLADASKDELKSAFKQAPWLRSALQTSLFGEEDGVDGSNNE